MIILTPTFNDIQLKERIALHDSFTQMYNTSDAEDY